MNIAIGSDHRGFEHKKNIAQSANPSLAHISWLDVGCSTPERCDYPEYAHLVAQAVLEKKADLGILLCGSGIGMAIAANRFKYIYAGLCWNKEVAASARQDDNVNILVLPADFISPQESISIIEAWLGAEFKGGQYQHRLDMLDKLA